MSEGAEQATTEPDPTATDLGTRLVSRWTDLGWAIRDARSALGLTQGQLAERAGVSRAWLARVEAGHRKAEIELLMRTVNALGLSFSLVPTPPAHAAADPELDEALRIAGLT